VENSVGRRQSVYVGTRFASRLQSTLARGTQSVVPVTLLIFAVPFITLLFYSVPAADDFCNASLSFNTVPQRSVLALTWLYYTRWSPRWLTYFIMGLSMSKGNLMRTYGWLLLLVAITNIASLWYFFLSVFNLSRTKAFVVASAFYALWISTLSSPDQQLYWLSDVIVYNLSLSSLIVLLSLLLRPRTSPWYYIAITLLSIAVPAQQEVAGSFLCVAVLAGVVIARIKKLPGRQWYLSWVTTTVSTCAVMLSPGNAIRAAAEHKRLWDVAHLPHWVAHSFYHGINWLSTPAILVGAIYILVMCHTERELHVADDPPPRWLALPLERWLPFCANAHSSKLLPVAGCQTASSCGFNSCFSYVSFVWSLREFQKSIRRACRSQPRLWFSSCSL
jgi:hypothetical protein